MNVSALIAGYDTIPYADRIASLIELGRASKTEASAKQLAEDLSNGSLYEQLLSLETCYGSHDVTLALKAIDSPSRHLRRRAISLVSLLGSDRQLLDALNSLPAFLQRYAVRRMRNLRPSRRRHGVIDRFVDGLAEKDVESEVFRGFLLYASEELVEKHLPTYIDVFNSFDWTRLATYHPNIAQRELGRWVSHSEDEDPRLLKTGNKIITQWSRKQQTADRALALLRTMAEKTPLSKLPLRAVLQIRCKEIIAMVLDAEGVIQDFEFQQVSSRRASSKMAKSLSISNMLALLDRYEDTIDAYDLYMYTPEQRRAIYGKVREAWRESDGTLSTDIICSLPVDLRVKEARRCLKLRAMEAKPASKIPYISLLPWDEAIILQRPFLQSSDADTRMSALQWQIEAAKYNESHLSDALDLIVKRQNEQDPMRRTMISALRTIPTGRWTTNHLPALETIIGHALDAGDLSSATHRELLGFVTRMLIIQPEWAAAQYTHIQTTRGFLDWNNTLDLCGSIPIPTIMGAVRTHISPILSTILSQRKTSALLAITQQFEQVPKHWPELQEAIITALTNDDDDREFSYYSDRMLTYLIRARPNSWFSIIPQLFEKQRKIVGRKTIANYVRWHEPQRVGFYIMEPYAKDDNWGRRSIDVHFKRQFWRMTPKQQESLAAVTVTDLEDPSIAQKYNKICRLALLPFVDAKHLMHFGRLEERAAIRDPAVMALGMLDSDQGVPLLLDALHDRRARIAIYSLRRTFNVMSKSKVLKLLSAVPMEKVTVAKEAVRLIGDLGTEEAFQHLLAMEKQDLHKDVRIALCRALWSFLGRPQTWEIYGRAALDPEPEISKAVVRIPDDGLTDARRTDLLKTLLKLLNHQNAEVRIETLTRLETSPLKDTESILSPKLFELILSPLEKECEGAAKAIFTTYAKSHHELVGDVFRKILPNKRVLKMVHKQYIAVIDPVWNKPLFPCTRLILDILAQDRLTTSLRLALIFHGIPFSDQLQYLLGIIPSLHPDALHMATMFISRDPEDGYNNRYKSPEPPKPIAIANEQTLGEHQDPRGRRLGLAYLCMLGGERENEVWTREMKKRLEWYKSDEDPGVAEWAELVDVPEVEEEDGSDGDDEERRGGEGKKVRRERRGVGIRGGRGGREGRGGKEEIFYDSDSD
ncbi:hypothetical protein BGZ60DRAFT_537224 [Tricladium varicosporioides]|nr:hypothetical protein BGZ60DRAFT_537224 [Hymenoscyphus varicosporioides]